MGQQVGGGGVSQHQARIADHPPRPLPAGARPPRRLGVPLGGRRAVPEDHRIVSLTALTSAPSCAGSVYHAAPPSHAHRILWTKSPLLFRQAL